jgi:hypothetical protein
MRPRTITGAALAAAALTIALTGAASASTPADAPPGEGVIITCRNGEPVERRVTDADREKIEELRKQAAESPDGKVRVEGEDGKHRKIIVGERGEGHRSPEEVCANRR